MCVCVGCAQNGSVTAHDVVVTNPPYGEEHIRRLLSFCAANARPFLLLLPAYVAAKPYYTEAVAAAPPLLYLRPAQRYMYWTPHGLRDELTCGKHGKSKSHRNLPLGIRTSPFASKWHVSLAPAVSTEQLLQWWNARPPADLTKVRHLKDACCCSAHTSC